MQIDSSAYAYVTYRITINLSTGFSLRAQSRDAPQVPFPHLDVAPTELAAILLSNCYKVVAPTELRQEFAKAESSSVRSEIFIALIPTVSSHPGCPRPHDGAGAASHGQKLWLAWVKG
jgi:hypothetical protein